ncbi:hypothetical protein [Pseudanabaena yagii]|uniref:Glycosyltransferase 2-like domain-containing protein n=1 Tax=Pseudanabaena yagii GIHE-NHR1 TaxID=2722753 RepID=A0ABX1LRX4_9CYAN|nr:hypothetical protein [Pseudanabaena yagii]NMF56637.1 hypothetical protein [Pseudanabaena yagii GIHE-NHR1]
MKPLVYILPTAYNASLYMSEILDSLLSHNLAKYRTIIVDGQQFSL